MSNTGGPAFPTDNYAAIVPQSTGYSEGMTLRDYFAAKAMQAQLTGYQGAWYDRIAADAYMIADAMLKMRELE